MAKKINRIAKLQFKGGQAKPGAELASVGINMPQFCSAFNDKSKDRQGEIVPVVITVYKDKSFDFIIKTTPASPLLMKAANIKKGSSEPNEKKIGTISVDDIKKIAEYKMEDLNANCIEAAINIVAGTAKSMGLEIKGKLPEYKNAFGEDHTKKKKINKNIWKPQKIKDKKVAAPVEGEEGSVEGTETKDGGQEKKANVENQQGDNKDGEKK